MSRSYILAIVVVILLLNSVVSLADPLSSLVLTDAEMKKLKKYFPVDESDHLTWKGDPIKITLPVEKEKRLVFPSNVTVDIKGALNTDQLRLLNDNKSLYFTALKTFPNTRIFVTLKDSGEVVLIDLITSEHGSSAAQYIDIKNNASHENSIAMPVKESEVALNEKSVTYVDLIRFAWQQSFGPERLSKETPTYSRAPMHTQKFVSDLVYGDKVTAFPQSSWAAGKHFITAVILRNKYPHST